MMGAPFTTNQVDSFLEMIANRRVFSKTDIYLYEALNAFPVREKNVGVLFSKSPWYESFLLSFGIQAITITSEPIEQADPRLQIEKEPKPRFFDALFLIGKLKMLGDGDIKAMHEAKKLLNPKGKLYLSIPVGKEKFTQNLQRVYGEKRMKELFKGWRPEGYFGYSYEDLQKDPIELHEPVFVLKPVY